METMMLGAIVKWGQRQAQFTVVGTYFTNLGTTERQVMYFLVMQNGTGKLHCDYAIAFEVIELPPAPGTLALAKAINSD